jgi:hypothetical protein
VSALTPPSGESLPPQTPLTQSVAPPHCFPSAQAAQSGPPQSVSVSPSFLMPSLQLAD